MERRDFEELLAGYLEGDLTPGERDGLKAILEADSALRQRFLQEIQLNEALRMVSREAPAATPVERSEFAEEILSSWRTPTARKTPRVYRSPRARWKPIAAAASVLAAVGLLALLLKPGDPREPRVTKENPGSEDPAREAARLDRERRESELRLAEIERYRQEVLARQRAAQEGEERKKVEEELRRLEREKREIEQKIKTPPPPAPEVVKKPDPAPRPRQDPPPRATAVVAATLVHTRGDVYILSEGARKAARPGQVVLSGDGLETVGARSLAVFEYLDATQVELSGDTLVGRLFGPEPKAGAGKRVFVDRGIISADVAKQPADQQMLFTTPHSDSRIVGTSLVIAVDLTGGGSTTLEVDEGRVRFTRLRDGMTVEVVGGHYAVAATGVELSARPFPQDPRKKKPGPDQIKVDGAIQRGVQWLKAEHGKSIYAGIDQVQCSDELVLWTLVHAGVQDYDPEFSRLLRQMLEGELKFTYRVALQAMILEQIDRVKYQWRIQQCAQFLVDCQFKTGLWSYGEPSPFVQEIVPPKETATGSRPRPKGPEAALPPGLRPKPRVLRKVFVTKRRDGTVGGGDNSDSQYAALGLRACHDAGVVIPKEVIDLAVKWWARTQYDDEKHLKAGARGKGWAYGYDLLQWTGSMTAGAAGSLVIYHYIQGEDWRKDKLVADGLEWLAQNFSVTENPGFRIAPATFAYYLYALERLGILYGTEQVGPHEWYSEGSKMLLDAQRPDGSWKLGENVYYDSCFAILFLRRATAPLIDVASVDRFKKR